MQDLFFWKNWIKPSKYLYLLSLILLTISFLYAAIAYFFDINGSLAWGILSEINTVVVGLDKFQNTQLNVPAFVVSEQFVASPMQTSPFIVWAYDTFFLLALALLITVFSTLKKWAYYGGMTAFMIIVISLQVDFLWGFITPYISIGLILGFGIISHYFQSFRPDVQVLSRFLVFLSFIIVLLFLAYFTASHGQIVPLLLAQSLPTSMVLACLFLFYVAYEIINGLLYIATNTRSGQSLRHFSFLSVIYLVNVILVFLHNIKMIDWKLLYISPFVFGFCSVLLGIWGFKNRENLLATHLPFKPSGAILYIALAILTFATVGMAFGTANDPLIEALEDAIVYSHSIMGILFFFYVVINFGPIFFQGLAVHKVVFQPRIFQLKWFRVLALLLIYIILSQNNYFPVYQSLAAYANAKGDYHTRLGDYPLAESYYKQGLGYEFQNHKSNYALASLALLQGDNPTAGAYFKQALLKRPSAYAFAGLSRCLGNEDSFFESLFVLREGIQKFPKNPQLHHNLGYLYEKTKVLDSANYYYTKAQALGTPETSLTNTLALALKNDNLSLSKNNVAFSLSSNYTSLKANQEIMNKRLGKGQTQVFDMLALDNTRLSVGNFAHLYNAILNHNRFNTSNETPIIQSLIDNQENAPFYQDLQFALAVNYYYKNQKINGLDVLSTRIQADSSAKVEQQTLAFWLMKEKNTMRQFQIPNDSIGVQSLLNQNPFNPQALTLAIAYLNRNGQARRGYDVLMTAKKYAPDVLAIKRLYILQCLELYLKDYAQTALEQLPDADYQSFLPQYKAKLALMEKARMQF